MCKSKSVAPAAAAAAVGTTGASAAVSAAAAGTGHSAHLFPSGHEFLWKTPYEELAGRHVVVGLSGGVDSSVSAALLQQAGMKVTALFMKNWEEDDTDSYCAAAEDRKDAEKVCETLGIELKTINFAAEYWDRVFENFLSEYRAGRTPNPDILCNKEIKFKAFLDYALQVLKADFIATGHYCLRSFDGGIDAPAHLLRGLDSNKDQSYFLHAVGPGKLHKVLFPVGHLIKPEVRRIAAELGLATARKKDSTGICFIGEKRFNRFLHDYLPDASRKGPIITTEGKVIGEHPGLMYCTIGQRKGLHIGGSADGTGEAWYVVDKDLKNNALIVAQGHQHHALYAQGLYASGDTWIIAPPQDTDLPLECTCKIRYRQPDVKCRVERTVVSLNGEAPRDLIRVVFDEPVAAVAPGQSVVFYRGADCLGGAVIEAPIKNL